MSTISSGIVVLRHATETHLDLKWQTKTQKESWLFTERGLGFETRITERDSNSGPPGLKFSALTRDHFNEVLILRRHAYCS